MAVADQKITDRYAVYNGDCIEVLPGMKDESIHISIYSPPFAELYNYSSSDRDLSNCASYEQFLEHYGFLVREISRVTMPGRVTCVHCMDLKAGNGAQRDFPGDIIRLHEKHGFLGDTEDAAAAELARKHKPPPAAAATKPAAPADDSRSRVLPSRPSRYS